MANIAPFFVGVMGSEGEAKQAERPDQDAGSCHNFTCWWELNPLLQIMGEEPEDVESKPPPGEKKRSPEAPQSETSPPLVRWLLAGHAPLLLRTC